MYELEQYHLPLDVKTDGIKPAENHPHVRFLEFKRSPIFLPFIAINEKVEFEQSSNAGSLLPITVPFIIRNPSEIAVSLPLGLTIVAL